MIDRDSIEKLIKKELEDANSKHPQFADMNHAFGVIYEELVEAKREFERCDRHITNYLDATIEENFDKGRREAGKLQHLAINAIQEMIQVAAMAQKAIDGTERFKADLEV